MISDDNDAEISKFWLTVNYVNLSDDDDDVKFT